MTSLDEIESKITLSYQRGVSISQLRGKGIDLTHVSLQLGDLGRKLLGAERDFLLKLLHVAVQKRLWIGDVRHLWYFKPRLRGGGRSRIDLLKAGLG